ncbi:MAG: zeta toxin, partial [Alphaproteobacteria bacterium]|nr:zeta toxin [Alphaproteobacteria bacterium]
MATKRLRIIAGPNGSGKSTFINNLIKNPPTGNFSLGFYVNADDLQKELNQKGSISFKKYGLKIGEKELQNYFRSSTFSPIKLKQPDLWKKFRVVNNKLYIKAGKSVSAYIAADLAEFIRQNLLAKGLSFSFETVMSDKNKINFLRKAKKQDYRVYLYFFATEDPLININRVKIRVKQKGHNVPD